MLARPRRGGEGGHERAPGWSRWWLIVALAALLAVVASPVISWALGEGTPGILVAQFLDCQKGCAWIGEFISSDPKTAVATVATGGLAPSGGRTRQNGQAGHWPAADR